MFKLLRQTRLKHKYYVTSMILIAVPSVVGIIEELVRTPRPIRFVGLALGGASIVCFVGLRLAVICHRPKDST